MKKNTTVLTILLAGLFLSVVVISGGGIHQWGYNDHNGPDHWEELGVIPQGLMSQSPVNIEADDAVETRLPQLVFGYKNNVSLDVTNNGHTIKASVPIGSSFLFLNGKIYNLLQFHFHAQSEHRIDGELLPIEMHLVHQAADGELTVIGVLFEAEEVHNELAKVFNLMPHHEGQHVTVNNFDLWQLLPYSFKSYRYSGSLTTPPCSEGVNWIVMDELLEMSQEQIDDFASLFSGEEFPQGNRRPVQPINGRVIYTDGDDD